MPAAHNENRTKAGKCWRSWRQVWFITAVLANRRLQPLGHLSVGEMSLFQRVLMVKAETNIAHLV
jgi:hypothetical protein